jgi:copper chaperone
MKKLWLMLFVTALLFSCNSQTKSTEESAEKVQSAHPEWVEVVLEVEGMTCDGCENAIKAGVENLEGIDQVESSWEEGWTKVKFDQSLTSVEAIEGKITETGYVVEGEKARVNL